MDQKKTPLFDQLQKHAVRERTSYHVPGHKNGSVFPAKAADLFRGILSVDQTEIEGLDDLHQPQGVIREAQNLAAELYRTRSTFFLVGGSTAGNLAMMLTAARSGDKVLVQRNCHQSVFHGLELAEVNPVYLEPEIESETGLALGVAHKTLKQAVDRFPEAKAVFLTHPSYEGYGQPLSDHVITAHRAGMLMCVDEAHGAHLIYDGREWPQSALKAGADMVVHSAHKTLPAMTMASYLHINTSRVNEDVLRYYLRLLQSSSPSYPLMASLDLARAYLASLADEEWLGITDKIQQLKSDLASGPGWLCAPSAAGAYVQDPLKLAFVSRHFGTTIEWKKTLKKRGFYPELVSANHMLLTLPLKEEAIQRENLAALLGDVLVITPDEQPDYVQSHIAEAQLEPEAVSEPVLTHKEMKVSRTIKVSWQESAGYTAAETITPYPPGIPLILKGEAVTSFQLQRLSALVDGRAAFQTGTRWMQEGIKVFLT